MADFQQSLPEGKRKILDKLLQDLTRVTGIEAIVLGGSYARGTANENSDLDIGLYYLDEKPFPIDEIRHIAQAISTQGPPVVTDFYGWGAWVNGGAWIHTSDGKVDFLYRSLNQVERTLQEARLGIIHHDYDQQPTFGFYSVIYLAETQVCVPLYDPHARIAALKCQVQVYPPKLKDRVVSGSLWSAEFTLIHAREFATTGDVYNTIGCLARITSNLTQALFALNDTYFITDKNVMETVAAFSLVPPGYPVELNRILANPGRTPGELLQGVADLERVWRSVVALAGDLYQPKSRRNPAPATG